MRRISEVSETSSLLGLSSPQKSYKTAHGDSFEAIFLTPENQLIESITYAWNNINAWVEADSSSGNGNGGQRSPGASESPGIKWPWTKTGNGVPKQVLSNVSGVVRPGELLAILGASGAGKTTLLNVLTFRNTKNLIRVSGHRRINGVPVDLPTLSALSAYVQQDDLFVGTLTVREHLVFQALLRMHRHIPVPQRMVRIEEVIHEFGLVKCADSLIGEPGRIKGISGGEKKRLALASEVLMDPLLIFCDEPTSDLDTFMAQNIVSVLRGMALKGKTIVCTIHQPSSELFAMFDRILLMAEGRTAFIGDTKDALNFFTGQGFECPTIFNPADYFIETLAIQPGNEGNCLDRVAEICDAFDQGEAGHQLQILSSVESSETTAKTLQSHTALVTRSPYKASWLAQFRATLWRSTLTMKRDARILRVRFLETIITTLLLSVAYWRQVMDQDGVTNINGAIFLLLITVTFQNVFDVIDVFCTELRIFLREHINGMYRSDVYFLSKTLIDIPLFVIFPVIFTSICYYTIGLNPDINKFLVTCGIVILVSNVGVSFGYLISCISPTKPFAISLAALVLIPLMIFSGFFLNQASVPVYFIWIKYLSWFMYGNGALLINQWEDLGAIECNRSKNATCPANGLFVLATLNFNPADLKFDIVMMVVLLIGYRILAYLALLVKTYRQ